MKRINAIDILRALAITGMVQVHFTHNLSGYYDSDTVLHVMSDLIGSFPAPFFAFLVGMSFFISISRQERAGVDQDHIFDRNLRRGCSIFFFGLLFATLIWMPVEVFNWDILTLIGASLLFLFPLRRLTPYWLLSLSVMLILFSPVIRIWSEYHQYWDRWGEYVNPFNLKGVVLGFFANGYFPLIPWFLFPLVGYAVAKICFAGEKHSVTKYIPLSGLGLLVLAFIGLLGGQYYIGNSVLVNSLLADFTFYPASTTFLLAALGIIFISFWVLYTFFDSKVIKEGSFLTFCRRYSKYSLTVYIVHHAVHVWPLLIAAGYAGKRDHWYYFGEVMPTVYSLLLAVLFIVLFYLVILVWDKRAGKYSFEWLLARLIGSA